MRFVVAALLGSFVAGCGFAQVEPVATSGEQKSARHVYRGPECAAPNGDGTIKAQVLRALCAGELDDSTHSAMEIERRHKRFDDRRPDPVVAALNAIDGARAGTQYVALGMSTYYATLVDAAKLKPALERHGVTGAARDAFVELAMKAKADVPALAAKLDERRKHMYVDAPHEAVARRAAYFKEHAVEYARLDAVERRAEHARISRKAPAEIIADLGAIRGDYFAKCADAACRFDALPIEATHELMMLYVAADDSLRSRAEATLLREPAAKTHVFSVETGTALYEAMTEERSAWEQYKAAQEQGTDEVTLKARFGATPPVKVDPQTDYIGSDAFHDAWTLFAGGSNLDSPSGTVNAVKATKQKNDRGEVLAEISFRDVVSTDEVAKTAPVFVPASEASDLQPGETVVTLVAPSSRRGVVLEAFGRSAAEAKADNAGKGKGKAKGKSKAKAKTTAEPDALAKPKSKRAVMVQVRGERLGK
jgi:hypothetical protein